MSDFNKLESPTKEVAEMVKSRKLRCIRVRGRTSQVPKGIIVLQEKYDICWDETEFLVWAHWFKEIPEGEFFPLYELQPRYRVIRFGRFRGDIRRNGHTLVEIQEDRAA